MRYTTIFWDWNGTLLDDIGQGVACINALLAKRGKAPIDLRRYREVFGFPVVEYYKRLGFDFTRESFDRVADEYTEWYSAHEDGIALRKGVKEALAVYADKGLKQVILSASEKSLLQKGIESRGVAGYFDEILALDNVYAESKTELAREYGKKHPEETIIMIGDTEHDKEVAQILGIDCVLVAGGHADEQHLKTLGVPVVNRVNETYRYVLRTERGERRTAVDTSFAVRYKDFYDDLKNTNKTEDW